MFGCSDSKYLSRANIFTTAVVTLSALHSDTLSAVLLLRSHNRQHGPETKSIRRQKDPVQEQQPNRQHNAVKHCDLSPRRKNMQLTTLPKPSRKLRLEIQTLLQRASHGLSVIVVSCFKVQFHEMDNGIEELLVGYEGVFERCVEVNLCEKSLRGAVLLLVVEAGI